MIHKCHWSPLTSESLLAYWFLFQSTSEPMISDRWVVNGGSNRYTLFTTPSTTGSLFWDQSNVFIIVHLTLMHEQSLDPQEPTFQTSPCRGFYLLTHTREWKLAAQQQQPWKKKKTASVCTGEREGETLKPLHTHWERKELRKDVSLLISDNRRFSHHPFFSSSIPDPQWEVKRGKLDSESAAVSPALFAPVWFGNSKWLK